MIKLPDHERAFEYENAFYLTSHPSRLAKAMAQFELFQRTLGLAGDIVECGVFKGTSLIRLLTYRRLLLGAPKRVIAFDTFGAFPETALEEDQPYREMFLEQAGAQSIGREQLHEVLRRKGLDEGVELVEGDIVQTVPEYVRANPHLRLSFINLDTDIFEPAKVILEELYGRLVQGGVLLLDDYAVHYGETKAVDEFFAGRSATIHRLPYAATPAFVVKE